MLLTNKIRYKDNEYDYLKYLIIYLLRRQV